MDIISGYFEELFTCFAILLCSINMESMNGIIWVLISILNFFSISYLLGNIFIKKHTIVATPAFWIILSLFSLGISMPLFWIIQFAGRRWINKKKPCGNHLGTILFPSIVSAVYLLVTEFWGDLDKIENSGNPFAIGLISLFAIVLVELVRIEGRKVIIEGEIDDRQEQIYCKLATEWNKQRTLKRQERTISAIIGGEIYTFNRVSKKYLAGGFLTEDADYGGYIKKTYVKLDKTIKVVEFPVIDYGYFYSFCGAFMMLLMFWTPYLLGVTKYLTEYIK